MEEKSENKLNIDLDNIKYCTMTIIHNNPSIFENLFKLWTSDYEHNISSSDSIVLEIGGELFDLNNSNCLNETKSLENNIKCDYYSFGIQPFLPKSIKIKNLQSFYLSLIESEYNDEKKHYYCKYLNQLFQNYSTNKNWIDSSIYNCVYYNIHSLNIVFGISKVKYVGEKTSRYIIAYDNLIPKEIVIVVIKKIISELIK